MSPLKLVAGLLLLWEPLNFAARILEVWPTLAYRGAIAVMELAAHGIVALLCVAGGMMLLNDAPDGRLVARIAVVLSVLRVVGSLYWSVLPSSTSPGAEPIFAGIAIVIGATLLGILRTPRERPSL